MWHQKAIKEKQPGLEAIKLEYSLRLKIKRNDWLLPDTFQKRNPDYAEMRHTCDMVTTFKHYNYNVTDSHGSNMRYLVVNMKRIHYLCEHGIEKSIPCDQRFTVITRQAS